MQLSPSAIIYYIIAYSTKTIKFFITRIGRRKERNLRLWRRQEKTPAQDKGRAWRHVGIRIWTISAWKQIRRPYNIELKAVSYNIDIDVQNKKLKRRWGFYDDKKKYKFKTVGKTESDEYCSQYDYIWRVIIYCQ